MNRIRKPMHWGAAIALLVTLIVTIPGALGQENATITGTVTDPSGGVVPNAAITLTQVNTHQTKSTTSNSTGIYIFTALGIGHYSVSATAPGFKTFTQNDIVLNVGDTVRADIRLQIGSVRQSVTVAANALHLQSETNEISNLISGKQITQLETNGRNIISLATLGMGVANTLPDFNSIGGVGSNYTISFEGTRPDHNRWMIDGAEVYDRGGGGTIDIMPSPDALAQFKTLDSNYGPEYGIASGGTITMVIKSGTSSLHGGLWEFNRNDIFDANNYISKLNHRPKPELRLNIFGGNLGGPVAIPHVYDGRKRTFFFVNEEWRRLVMATNPTVHQDIASSNFPTLGQALVYTPPSTGKIPVVPETTDPERLALYEEDGLVPGKPFPNNTIPANLMDPNAVLLMNSGAIPHPNASNDTFILQTAFPTYVREDVIRIDHTINDKFQLMSHYLHDALQQHMNAPPGVLGHDTFTTVPVIRTIPSYSGVLKLTQTYTPTFVNQTAFNFNRDAISFSYAPGAIYQQPSGWSADSFFAGNNPLNKLPEISLGAPYGIDYTPAYVPYHNAGQSYQARDDVSWTKGKHEITFGGGFLRYTKLQMIQTGTEGAYGFTPSTFSGDSYVNFLLGVASSYSQLQDQGTNYWISNTTSLYFNDNWHVTPRLTLNLGVRYDVLPHTYERFNHMSNFVAADYNQAQAPIFNPDGSLDPNGPGFTTPPGFTNPSYMNGVKLAGLDGFPPGLVKNDWKTLEPRIGFATDLFGNGKTVLRGGFGLFYERLEGGDTYQLDANTPFAYQPSVTSVYFSDPSTSAINGAKAARPTFPATIGALAFHYPIPATAEYSLGIQRQIGNRTVAVLQYVGNGAWHQWDQREMNTLPLNSPQREAVAHGKYNANLVRQFPGFAGIRLSEMGSNSSYNSLQAGLRSENWHGLTLQLAYTYSHEIDVVSRDKTAVSDPFNLRYDRGSGTFDFRHIFSANYIYNLPSLRNIGNAFTRQVLGGWELSGITIAQSGNPQPPAYGPDVTGLGGGTKNRPNLIGKVRGPETQKEFFNTSAFAAPLAPWNGGANQGFGDAGKDSIVGPGRLNFNVALFKSFPLRLNQGEGARLEFRVESFNTFNHTQFNRLSTSYTAPTFGQVTNVWDPRVLQFGAKFLF